MSLYATMLHLNIKKAKVTVKTSFWGGGSVMAETVRTSCTGVETRLDIESEEDPSKIAKLVRVAEAGCYVIQTLRNPTPISLQTSLNGQDLDFQSSAKLS
ncbi:MAG: OsmC family protein [Candidatus Binatia bacterium]